MKDPTPRQLEVFATALREGSQKNAAIALNVSLQSVKNHIGELYLRLDAQNMCEAATKLGWLRLPGAEPVPENRDRAIRSHLRAIEILLNHASA